MQQAELIPLTPLPPDVSTDRPGYKELKALALELAVGPADMLAMLAEIYRRESARLDNIFFTEDMPLPLGFQYQQSIRLFKGLARQCRAAADVFEANGGEFRPLACDRSDGKLARLT